MQKALLREWTEARGEGWGTTIYKGIFIPDLNLIVTKLSHGLRVLEFNDPNKYRFNSAAEREVEVPEDLIEEALVALAADKRFQLLSMHDYEKATA